MSRSPAVSVVMSVFNGEPYLETAIESILAQTFSDYELIVVDDASKDGTWRILQKYAASDRRLVLVRNSINLGLTRSLNKGFQLARGRLFARQDADDFSLPDRLRMQVKYMKMNPTVGLLGTWADIIDDQGRCIATLDHPIKDETIQSWLLWTNCFVHGSTMFRRECINKVGYYDEFYPVAQDYDLWLRVSERTRVGNLDTVLYQWRQHDTSISASKADLQRYFSRMAITKAIGRRLKYYSHLTQAQKTGFQIFYTIEGLRYYCDGMMLQAHENWDIAFSGSFLAEDLAKLLAWELINEGCRVFSEQPRFTSGLNLAHGIFSELSRWHLPISFQRQVIAEIHLSKAFVDHAAGNLSSTRINLLRAVKYNPSNVRNFGAWSIGLDAFFGRYISSLVRGIKRQILSGSSVSSMGWARQKK